jgi:putative tricarboxylic transport membrane protein
MTERLLALGVLAACGGYLANAWALPVGTAARPGPGFYPLAVGIVGVAVALAWLASTLRQEPVTAGPTEAPAGRARVLAAAGLLVGFCLFLPWTGYPVAALLFVGLLLRALGSGWMAALSIGAASALLSYYVFGVLLGVPLPPAALP